MKKKTRKKVIIGSIILALALGFYFFGMNKTDNQGFWIVQPIKDNVMSCDDSICSFSLSDSHRDTGWTFELWHDDYHELQTGPSGVYIEVDSTKCSSLGGLFETGVCYIHQLLNNNIDHVVYSQKPCQGISVNFNQGAVNLNCGGAEVSGISASFTVPYVNIPTKNCWQVVQAEAVASVCQSLEITGETCTSPLFNSEAECQASLDGDSNGGGENSSMFIIIIVIVALAGGLYYLYLKIK
jgi:hypothetical protein